MLQGSLPCIEPAASHCGLEVVPFHFGPSRFPLLCGLGYWKMPRTERTNQPSGFGPTVRELAGAVQTSLASFCCSAAPVQVLCYRVQPIGLLRAVSQNLGPSPLVELSS